MLGQNVQRLAIPGVILLVSFLSYSSQLLFVHIQPGPLSPSQAIVFNVLVVCLLICYARSCLTDPGLIKKRSTLATAAKQDEDPSDQRWCPKCDAPKPPRSHHCRICNRCIAKMDHHCPWTGNCVGHRTYPHFVRFLFYAVAAMTYLGYFLYIRLHNLWQNRNLSSVRCIIRILFGSNWVKHHGPSVLQLGHLVSLCFVEFVTLFVLSILLGTSLWALGANIYTIEGWEIERHETLLRRARRNGGYVNKQDGTRLRLVKQEFPYDIGISQNIAQGMGSSNPLSWFWPFAMSPTLDSGLHFDTNGFEEPSTSWPPPDPDREAVFEAGSTQTDAFVYNDANLSPDATASAFRRRQENDYRHRNILKTMKTSLATGPVWRDSEIETPADFGIYEHDAATEEDDYDDED